MPLLGAEGIKSLQRLIHRSQKSRTLAVGDLARFARHHIGHLENRRHQGRVHAPPLLLHLVGDPLQHGVVVHEQLPVDGDGDCRRIGLHINIYVDFAALYGLADPVSDLVFQGPVDLRYSYAVERAYLHRYFPVLRRGFGLAVAGHRFYHEKKCFEIQR